MHQLNNVEIQPHIPFQIRLQLSQLDVHLDQSWHSTLVEIFKTQDKAVQKLIYEQILVPKGIEFNAEKQQFISTKPRLSLNTLRTQLTAPQTRMLAQNLLEGLDIIAKQDDLLKLGEYLESILAEIDELNTEDKPQINVEKNLIKTHFLYDVAFIITNNSYQTPKNIRGLTSFQIQSYILDVFIRKQVAGFSFNPVRSQVLKRENSPIMDYIIEQRKTRLFEVYEGQQYYYLVTPASHDEDPYSIRRFLYEEASRVNDFYYLNGTILDKQLISNQQSAISNQQSAISNQQSAISNQQSYSGYDNYSIVNNTSDNSFFSKVKHHIESFVSINRSISLEMINFMEQLDLSFQKHILPLLEQDLNQKLKYTRSVADRLFEIEQAISVYILQEVERAKFKIASSQDDFEYLFIHSLTLFSNIVFAYEIFQSQPALLFNNQAKSFKYRLIAWMKIMQKRQHEVFVPLRDEEEQQNAHRNALTIYENIKTILDNTIKENRQISKEIKVLEKKKSEQENAGFFKRLFASKLDYLAEIEQLNKKETEIKRVTFLDIIKQAKKYQRNVIYLEYENVISITDTHRHYAINMGRNGFTRLPILIQLPEEKEFFDISQTYNTLLASFATINQDWTIEQFEQNYHQN